MSNLKVSDSSVISIPLRNLVAIIFGVSVAVSGYFALTQRLDMIEKDTDIMKVFVDQNSEFRVKWPRGELGALPDDAEQNMRLRFIEKDMQMIEAHVDTLRIRSVQQEELHNPPHPFMPQSPLNRKEAGGLR